MRVMLNYQQAPGEGEKVGRYINWTPDSPCHVDVHAPTEVEMRDARALMDTTEEFRMLSHGFELCTQKNTPDGLSTTKI